MRIRSFKTAGRYWVEDHAAEMAAALAYYALFSMAPLLIIALAVAGQVYGEEAARGQLVDKVRDLIGADSAAAVQTMLENFRRLPTSLGPAVIGILALVYGSLGVFTQMHSSLQRIWRLKPLPKQGLVGGFAKTYLLAFLMVQVTCVFVLLLLSTTTVLSLFTTWWGTQTPGDGWTWHLGDFVLSSFLIALLIVFTFRFMSDGRVPYRYLWGGAMISAILFGVGKMLIGLYLSRSHLASAYGAAGSLVVFLTWVYYSAHIFFFGAEIVRARLER